MSKKTCLLLCFLVLIPLATWSAATKFTASSSEGVMISFTVYNELEKTAWVSSNAIDVATEGVLTIPSTINGYTITGVYNGAFANCNKLDKIIFPNTITSFQYIHNSFTGCSAEVEVSNENTTFFSREGALYKKNTYDSGCELLFAGGKCTSFTVKSDVTQMYNGAFYNSTQLESIIFELEESALSIHNNNDSYSSNSPAFKNCPLKYAICNRELYASNSSIEQPFKRNATLESITLGSKIRELEDYMFYGCTSLSSIDIQGEVYSIGYHVFDNTAWLENCTATNGVKYLGNYAIAYDGTTQNVLFKNTTVCVANGFFVKFGGTSIEKVTLPTSITAIPKQMFGDCKVGELTIPSNINRISYNAFYDGINTTSINLLKIENSDNILKIESSSDNSSASFRKTKIGEVIIERPLQTTIVTGIQKDYSHPFGEATIEKAIITHEMDISDMFYNSKVVEVEFPADMSNIGDYAFYGCTTLNKIISKASVPPVVSPLCFNNDFYKTATLYVPYDYRDSYSYAAYWQDFKDILYYDVDECAITANKICTYSSNYSLDFTNVTGLKAYIVSGFSPSTCTLVLTPATTIPAGEGLLLKGEEGTYVIPHTTTDMIYSNLLVGVPTTTYVYPTNGEYTNFILANGKHGINFYTLSEAGNIAGGKAYLQLPTSEIPVNSRPLKLSFTDEEISGINTAQNEMNSSSDFYDLQGRKVKSPVKGLYIINGKKVIIK